MRNAVPALNARDGRNFTWDYIILDEAHQIKVIIIGSSYFFNRSYEHAEIIC